MVTSSNFLPEDQRKLDAMLDISSRERGTARSLEALVGRWQVFVAEMERGQRSSSSEYERGLAIRALLDELCECLSPDGRQILLAALLDSDRRFLALTAPANGSLRRRWWKRYPDDLAA